MVVWPLRKFKSIDFGSLAQIREGEGGGGLGWPCG